MKQIFLTTGLGLGFGFFNIQQSHAQESISSIAQRIGGAANDVQTLLIGGAVLIGFFFVIKGIMGLKGNSQGQQSMPQGQAWAYIFIGAALSTVSSVMGVINFSIFGS